MNTRGQRKGLFRITGRGLLGLVFCTCISQTALGEAVLLGVDSSGTFLIGSQTPAILTGLGPASVEVSTQGIRGSGVRGIRGSGVRGIRGSGVRDSDEAEALGIRGSGVRGIRGSGVRSAEIAGTQGIRGSGLRDQLSSGRQIDMDNGMPLLAIGPVTRADKGSISVLGSEFDLGDDAKILSVDPSGQISTMLARENSSVVAVGDYIAVGGLSTFDSAVVDVIVVSPDLYLDGSSLVYLRELLAALNQPQRRWT